jgi:hypothetical protein
VIEKVDVARVKQIETAVREDNAIAVRLPSLDLNFG